MLKTTPLVLAALLAGRFAPALAQNTPDENNENADAPFVRHIRPDRPGQTITAGVLRPGEFQLELGAQQLRPGSAGALNPLVSTGTLRIGFWNSMELRVSQAYAFQPVLSLGDAAPAGTNSSLSPGRWQALVVGTKLMLTPDRASRFQASILAEAAVPATGQGERGQLGWAPAGRLLLSQQLGQRAALEANAGFGLAGLTAEDYERGEFVGTLALVAPLGERAGYYAEAYARGRDTRTTGATAGLYFRPWTGLRFDASLGRVLAGPAAGATTMGLGLALRLGGNLGQ